MECIKNIDTQKNIKTIEDEKILLAKQARDIEAGKSQLAEQKRKFEIEKNQLAGQKREFEIEKNQLTEQKIELETEKKQLAEQKRTFETERVRLEKQRDEAEAEKNRLMKIAVSPFEYNKIIEIPNIINNKPYYLGNATNFTLCVPENKKQDYIDLKFIFHDDTFVDKIEFIFMTIITIDEDGKRWLVFKQAYKPQQGVNAIKLKNYFITHKNINIDLGYVLKTEMGKEIPRLEKITYK